jgi:deoxyhypusine synthase
MNVRVLTEDNFDDFFMTNEKYEKLANLLRKQIKSAFIIKSQNNDNPIKEIEKAIRESVVPELNGPHSQSSASFPQASKYWVIGIFGSVWLDTKVGNDLYRVAWVGDKEFHVDKCID